MKTSITLAACALAVTVLVAPARPDGASITVGDEVVFSGGPGAAPRSIQTGFTLEASNIRGTFGDGARPGKVRTKGEPSTTTAATSSVGNRPAWMADLPGPHRVAPSAFPDLSNLSTDELNAAIGDSDPARRRGAVGALASRTSPAERATVRAALEAALTDREPRVVQDAANALGRLGDVASAPAVLRLVSDRDDDVAISAIQAVQALGYRAAIPELTKLGERDTGRVGRAAQFAAKVLANPPRLAGPAASPAPLAKQPVRARHVPAPVVQPSPPRGRW